MKRICISFPIIEHEDDYEQLLDDAVEYVKANYPEYDSIITLKEISERLEDMLPMKPTYKEYLLAEIKEISLCDALFVCREGIGKGCFAEWAFAIAIGLTVLYQPD